MNLVTVNVKLGENDPKPEQKLEPVCYSYSIRGKVNANEQGEHIVRRVVPVKDLHAILQGGSCHELLRWGL